MWPPRSRGDNAPPSDPAEPEPPALRTSARGDAASSSGAPAGSPVPYRAAQPTTTGTAKQPPATPDEPTKPEEDRESDRHPPVLQFLRFDPPEIQDGGVVTLSVGAGDDLSGVKSVLGTVLSPSEAAIVPFGAQDATGAGVFTTSIAIPRQAETGMWLVGSLEIVDNANNALTLVFRQSTVPQGGVLRVFSQESDSTAPDVRRLSLDKGTVGAGEKNQIVVDVDDDCSGVASVAGTFQSPSGSAFIVFSCAPIGDPPLWVGDVPIPADAHCGEWTLNHLRVADKANNSSVLTIDSPQVGRVSFGVSGGGACDPHPPTVDGLYFSPAIVSNTAAVAIILTIAAHDNESGLGSLSGRVEGPASPNGLAPSIFFASVPDPKDPEAPMTATVPVAQFAAKGIWRVVLLQVWDNAKNLRTYHTDDPPLRDGSFTVE